MGIRVLLRAGFIGLSGLIPVNLINGQYVLTAAPYPLVEVSLFQRPRSTPPRILLVGRGNYLGVARLPQALADAGGVVETLCHPQDILFSPQCISRRHCWFGQRSGGKRIFQALDLLLLTKTILLRQPSLIIPADEPSIKYLHMLQKILRCGGIRMKCIDQALPRSVDAYKAAMERHSNQRLAEDLGIRCPAARQVSSVNEFIDFARQHDHQVVLKAENTSAGSGVIICRGEADVRKACEQFQSSLAAGALAQQYVCGRGAMSAASLHQGEVLAHLNAIKLQVHPQPTGPSCIVRFVEHPEMLAATKKMAQVLGYTGFISLDFIIDETSGYAYLIECNPRPVPICHFGQLANKLLARLGQIERTPQAEALPQQDVALFPQEILRLGGSLPDSALYHDRPDRDPSLLLAYEKHLTAQMRR